VRKEYAALDVKLTTQERELTIAKSDRAFPLSFLLPPSPLSVLPIVSEPRQRRPSRHPLFSSRLR
jgi:hypothetical protein